MGVVAQDRPARRRSFSRDDPGVAHAAGCGDPASSLTEHRQQLRTGVAAPRGAEGCCQDRRIRVRVDDVEAGGVLGTDRPQELQALQLRVPVHAQPERQQLERGEAVHRLPWLRCHAEQPVFQRQRAPGVRDRVHPRGVRLEHPARLRAETQLLVAGDPLQADPPDESIDVHAVRPDDLADPARGDAPGHLHLPETLLRMDDPHGEGGVLHRGRRHMGTPHRSRLIVTGAVRPVNPSRASDFRHGHAEESVARDQQGDTEDDHDGRHDDEGNDHLKRSGNVLHSRAHGRTNSAPRPACRGRGTHGGVRRIRHAAAVLDDSRRAHRGADKVRIVRPFTYGRGAIHRRRRVRRGAAARDQRRRPSRGRGRPVRRDVQ